MRVVNLENLTRKDVQIFYIRKYAATAVMDLTASTASVDIEFSIEMNSFGNKTYTLSLKSPIDYPLIPVRKSILEYITNLEMEGKLPC